MPIKLVICCNATDSSAVELALNRELLFFHFHSTGCTQISRMPIWNTCSLIRIGELEKAALLWMVRAGWSDSV